MLKSILSGLETYVNYDEKNRMILKIHWTCVSVILAIEVLGFLYYGIINGAVKDPYYTGRHFLWPVFATLALSIMITLVYRATRGAKAIMAANLIMAGLVVFVNALVMAHPSVNVIHVTYILPVSLSLFYSNRRMTLMVSAASLISYLVVATFHLPTRDRFSNGYGYADIAATLAVILLSIVVGMKIIDIYSDLISRIVDQTIKKIAFERETKEDPLTKLYNHSAFYDSLDMAIVSCRDMDVCFCLTVMDIDNFKRVNDTYGHALGDTVILKLVDAIREHTGEIDMAFRYGGEEFTLISFRGLEETVELNDKIRETFSQTTIEGHPEASVSVSMGVSQYLKKFPGKREFFASADRALYTAKRTGKNKVVVATDEYEDAPPS